MPITLNHSNISVQYSSDKSYIIETVKSDLYLKNDNYDNIVRNNLQTAPVTPIVSIQEGSNVYAVESYTYSGSANTADFTRVFPKNTLCDILVVGGGGGGGDPCGGGGGAGQLVFIHQATLNGSYTIKVGKGGIGGVWINTAATKGINSEFGNSSINVIAEGGGANGGTNVANKNGGSGAGGDGNPENGGTSGAGNKDTTVDTFSGATVYSKGNNGGINSGTAGAIGGGGGGAGEAGQAGTFSINGKGGDGLSGIPEINYDFKTNFGNYGKLETDGKYYFAGGGGGGPTDLFNGGKGGGGSGGIGSSNPNNIGGSGTPNTGGGGGGGGGNTNGNGGAGGSGIVIIRYLLGTIPATNVLTNEPVVIAPTFTETVRSFIHSGGAEAQTTHTITVGRDTICDILVVGGGGGGGSRHSGGGGAGAVIYSTNITLTAGTYTIGVGKGGNGASGSPSAGQGNRGEDSRITFNSTNIYLAKGGGAGNHGDGTDNSNRDGGSGGGGGSAIGLAVSTNIPSGTYGNSGGLYTTGGPEGYAGGGGGGSGTAGSNATLVSGFGRGGTGGNGTQISITGTNVYYGGGGGGGAYSEANNIAGTGGLGGGGAGSKGTATAVSGTAGTGGGGGGGGFSSSGNGPAGAGGSGIIIIRLKSLAGPILEGITHKRLNFVYNSDNLVAWYRFNGDYLDSSGNGHNLTNVGTIIQSTQIIEGQAVEFDSTDYLEFPSTINPYTIWNGKGITFSFWVRFTSITGTYSRFIDFQSGASGASGIFFAFKAGTDAFYLNCAGTTLTYSNSSIITTLGVWHHIVWSIDITGKWDLYLNNVRINNTETSAVANITYNLRYINKSTYPGNGVWGGQMDDFRIYERALSSADVASLYNKTYPAPSNTYTLNFLVPTVADINNNSNIVLRGVYDIALSTSNAVIIPKADQYIPKPTTFTNYSVERMYPPVRNFTAATTTVSGQTYGNGNYVVTFSSTTGSSIDPWTCFNTGATTGGHWAVGRYTAGVFNNTSFIVAGYLGDWVKIQLPVAIKLTRFNFVSRPTYQVRSPKDFKIYGSNDNITWVELVNKTDAAYNASNIYEQTTPEITNTYTYYGLVVNKIFSDTVLNFDEWYIYGQEVSTSSLSLRYHLLNPILDPIGAQWTYSSNNTNVYHMGSVGIGTTSPEYQLDVRGAIYSSVGGYTQTGLTSWSITSDRRIKENITRASYDKCLENVKNIELYNFNFKNNCVNTNDKHQLGFIAQEVQQVYPKAVEVGKIILNTNEAISDILTLNTTQIDYTLYGAVKNLIEKIEDIDNDLENIEKAVGEPAPNTDL